MSEPNEPRRWTEGPGSREAELFRAAQPVPPPLSPEALARIEYGVTAKLAVAAKAALWMKVLVAVAVVAGGSAAAVMWMGARGEPAPVPEPPSVPLLNEPPSAPPQPEVVQAPAPAAPVVSPEPKPQRRPRPDALAEESRLLESAFRFLRVERNPAAALGALDEHRRRFPNGQLSSEADRARLDAYLALGRHAEAAALAGQLRKDANGPRALELEAVEGEQLFALGNRREALSRFEHVIAAGANEPVAERAWFGRIQSRRALGDVMGAAMDAREYLSRFPNGAHAEEVRSLAVAP